MTLAETKRDVTLCGGIHWEKFRFMGELILRLTQAISFATLIQPNPGVLAFVSDTTLLTEAVRTCRHEKEYMDENTYKVNAFFNRSGAVD